MIQHVSLEVNPRQMADCVRFWELLGFDEMPPPPRLGSDFRWVQRERTQIHLMPADDPTAARRGHVAIVAADYERDLAALREAGFEPEPGEDLWGAPRSFVRDPAGHLVEVMSRPPYPPWPD